MLIKQWLNHRRFTRQLKALENSVLSEIYRPPTIDQKSFKDADCLVLDFETTGLNPKNDRVLSAGWTTISNARMHWKDCQHYLFKDTEAIPDQSVAIHHITEQEAAQGVPVTEVLPHLLAKLSGKVLVAHFADIEIGFLQQLCRKHYHTDIPLVVIDTLQLAFSVKYKGAVHIPQNALNLTSLRMQYELPHYRAHNARSDAIATAELLMALVEGLDQGNDTALATILRLASN